MSPRQMFAQRAAKLRGLVPCGSAEQDRAGFWHGLPSFKMADPSATVYVSGYFPRFTSESAARVNALWEALRAAERFQRGELTVHQS